MDNLPAPIHVQAPIAIFIRGIVFVAVILSRLDWRKFLIRDWFGVRDYIGVIRKGIAELRRRNCAASL